MLLAACGGERDSLTVELEEVNGSGVSGQVKLEKAGERTTRMFVTDLRGGPITAAWIATGTCEESGDEIVTIHPPAGRAPIAFADIANASEPLVALFLRRGRFVACGDL